MVWNRPWWVKPGLTRASFSFWYVWALPRELKLEPRLPGKKHSISVCVPKWETWRWFSKPSSLTAPVGECFAIRHTHPSELVYGASGLAVKTHSRRPPSFSNRSRRESTIETCLYNSDFLSNIRRTSDKSSTLTARTDFCWNLRQTKFSPWGSGFLPF